MFTHLHVHTEYSLLDGLSKIPNLVSKAADLEMDSLAITDHGVLYGAVDFYSECVNQGIKPIIGCELYMAQRSHLDKENQDRSPHHMTVLAINNVGYNNLVHLVTIAHLDGFYYRPRIDMDLLKQYNEGLIILSGCPSAEIPRLIAQDQYNEAKIQANLYKNILPDRYFFELQRHTGVPNLEKINESLVSLGQEIGVPVVATNDTHYTHKDDSALHDVLLAIQTTTTLDDTNRLRMEDDSFYLKSDSEMKDLFPDIPDALQNTTRISEMCDVKMTFGETHLPEFTPLNDLTADEYLEKICMDGFKTIYQGTNETAEKRLRYELEIIRQTQFANYFLIVWDISAFAKRNKILFSVRGSAAGSLVLYLIGVTAIDPLSHKLVFERFLNVERKELPDIDLDFQDDRRDEVLNYVTHKYGKDKVAQIITFGTFKAKAAIRDVGRTLGYSQANIDKVARLVPLRLGTTLDSALDSTPELKNMYETDESIKKLVDTSKGLEGVVHHASTHAAGVVISEKALTELLPLQRPSRSADDNDTAMTQFAMDPVSKLGLIKMDFLGLTNLTILDKTIKLLKQEQDLNIPLESITLDDSKTFDLLSSGKTTDVFQLESSGMQRHIKELKPSAIGDISAMIALYRPGPMEHIETFIKAKHGETSVTYPHESLEPILEDTYGIIVFQDQVLHILRTLAGYSLGEADIVRKAMGKKIPELMQKERDQFINGAISKGYTKEIAQKVFALIEPFAGYAFPRAHSASYALISYWTAYFKANHPVAYMTSVLNSRLDKFDRISSAIAECFRMQIPVLPPDINLSQSDFSIDKSSDTGWNIRYGLAAIKNVGELAVKSTISIREQDGQFGSVDDFVNRAGTQILNKRTLDSLMKVGALQSFGDRTSLLESLDQILAIAQRETRMRASGQTSMFDHLEETDSSSLINIKNDALPTTLTQKITWEQELLGVEVSTNPLENIEIARSYGALTSIDEIDIDIQKDPIKVFGRINAVNERLTKQNKTFGSVSLDMLGGSLDVLAWPEIFTQTHDTWQTGNLVLISGQLKLRGEDVSLHCSDIAIFNPSLAKKDQIDANDSPPPNKEVQKDTYSNTILISFKESSDKNTDIQLFKTGMKILLEHPGTDQVRIEIVTSEHTVQMEMPSVTTTYASDLHKKIDDLLGIGNIKLLRH